MPMGQKSTVLERTAHLLGPRYEISAIREDHDGGYVGFNDPFMYRKEWAGPIYGGVVRYSASDLKRLKNDPNAGAEILKRVEEAKAVLLDQITEYQRKEGVTLAKWAVSLSLVFLCIPVMSLLGQAA